MKLFIYAHIHILHYTHIKFNKNSLFNPLQFNLLTRKKNIFFQTEIRSHWIQHPAIGQIHSQQWNHRYVLLSIRLEISVGMLYDVVARKRRHFYVKWKVKETKIIINNKIKKKFIHYFTLSFMR